MQAANERVPVRTIATTIGMVLATVVAGYLLVQLHRIVVWLLVAVFLTVLLNPVVSAAQRRLRLGRGLATSVSVLAALLVLVALGAAFVAPLVREGSHFAHNAPGYVDQVRNGQGPLGDLVARFHLDNWVAQHRDKVTAALTGAGIGTLNAARAVGNIVVATVTVFVLTVLMLLEAPKLVDGSLALLRPRTAERVRRVGGDCSRAVLGYMTGNLLISLICGLTTWVVLLVMRVPYAGVLALFVALADLVPLIGATVGAVVAVVAAFVHSVPAGIVVLVWFVVYQQLENHALQPVIMSRTVKLNPLAVLVSVIVGVELLGILGALIAIPVAGIIQVVARDVWDGRHGRAKAEPTVGEDRTGVDAEVYPTEGSTALGATSGR